MTTPDSHRLVTSESFFGACPEQSADRAMRRLLSLETPEDAKAIYELLREDWRSDVAGAFGEAARKHFGMEPL